MANASLIKQETHQCKKLVLRAYSFVFSQDPSRQTVSYQTTIVGKNGCVYSGVQGLVVRGLLWLYNNVAMWVDNSRQQIWEGPGGSCSLLFV